jgi:ActR/RegA family two-component response regulator
MLLRAKDPFSSLAAVHSARIRLEFLVVSNDHQVLKPLAESIHTLHGRPNCIPSVATARDYLGWRKVDGIVIDMNLPGALELIGCMRGGSPNRFSVVFACVASSAESQVAIRAGANFVLHRPLVPDKIAHVLTAAAEMMVAEKRRYSRYPLMVPVELKMEERQMECTMSNLSEGGMAVWSLSCHKPGSSIQFAFEIPFGGLIRGDGQVAWTNADGVAGIKFDVLADEACNHLSGWVARRHAGNGT